MSEDRGFLAIGALIVALFIGIGVWYWSTIPPDFDSGIITGKYHKDGYYYTTYVCAAYRTDGGCSVQVPVTNYQPPRWYLHLKRCGEDNKCHIGEHDIDQYTWIQANVGDYFDHGSVRPA